MLMTLIIIIGLLFIVFQLFFYLRFTYSTPDFQDKVIFITGGSSGIGEQMTKRFIELGAKQVIIASRNIQEMQRVKNECKAPDRVRCVVLDLSNPKDALKTLSNEKFEKVDIIVNNAGTTMRDIFERAELQVCEAMMNINCLSHIAVTKHFLPILISQKSRSQIVNIISIAGLLATGYRSMYCAAKFGTQGFFKSLRSEIKQYGISVNNIYPEYVQTNIARNAFMGDGSKLGKVDTNIAAGIPCDVAVDQILKCIYLNVDEYVLARPFYKIMPIIYQISASIRYKLSVMGYQQAVQAMKGAK